MGREKGRIAKFDGPESEIKRFMNAERMRKARERAKEMAEKREQLAEVLPDEVKVRLGQMVMRNMDKLEEIANGPKRNAGVQLQAIRLMMDFALEKPKQEISGEVGVKVVVNTMRKESPPAAVVALPYQGEMSMTISPNPGEPDESVPDDQIPD